MKKKSLNFVKMSGAGNDFLIIENSQGANIKNLAIKMCNRTNGVGADGLLILDKSKKADYKMRIINADGSEAEMCGNGVRCLAAYIAEKYNPQKKIFSIETLSGLILGKAKGEMAHVRLGNPLGYKGSVPIRINKQPLHVAFVDTGVPHAIVFVDNLKKIDVKKIGSLIRFNPKFKPRGTNVNFVEQINKTSVEVRTYERGVEDETNACGTGSVAAGIVTYLKANHDGQSTKKAAMKVKTQSSEILKISFDIEAETISNVWLQGSAKFIAEGKYYR